MSDIIAIKTQGKKIRKTISFGKFQLSLNFNTKLQAEERCKGVTFAIELSHQNGEIFTLSSYLFELRRFGKRVRLLYYKRKRILRKEDGKDHN